MTIRAFDLALQTPWAIEKGALDQLLSIAARAHEPDFLVAAKELGARWAEITGEPEAITVHNGKRMEGTSRVVMRGNIAVLPIEGPMFRYANLFSAMSGATSLEMLANDLAAVAQSKDVKGVLLHIDSPGGQVNGTGEFADAIYRLRGQKPVVAYISNQGCSAAYWVASAADRIEVAPTAIVGNIGCIAGVGDPHPTPGGPIPYVSSQSPQKAPDPHTAAGNAALQGYVDDLAQEFINTVARNRGISPDQVESDFGQGWVFVGQKAVDAGLADSVSMYEDTLARLQEEVGSKKDTPSKPDSGAAVEDPSPEDAGAQAPRKQGKMTDKNLMLRVIASVLGSKGDDGDDEKVAQLLTEAADHPTTTEEGRMSPNPSEAQTTTPAPSAGATDPSEVETLRRQVASLEARNQDLLMKGIKAESEKFAKQVIDVEHRAFPSERAVIEQEFTQAALDDLVLPAATVKVGDINVSKKRVELVQDRYQARPQNILTTEMLQSDLHRVLVNSTATERDDGTKPLPDEKVKELVALTRQGAAALNGTATNTNGTRR